MALKKILKFGDEKLRTPSKEVHKVSKKIQILVHDMLETMYAQNGVGLAAPQIGENLRIFVIDVSAPEDPIDPIVFINPKIIKKSGAMVGNEGCLSFPEVFVNVKRYSKVTVKALDSRGKSFVIEAPENSLLARAIQHEFDHLDGILFVDHCVNRFETEQALEAKNLPPLQLDKLLSEPDIEELLNND